MSWQENPPYQVGILTDSNSWSGIIANDYVNGLLIGGVWGNKDPDDGDITSLSYSYVPQGWYTVDSNYYYAYTWENYERAAISEAMDAFSDVANIRFTETENLLDANIKWASLNNEHSFGYAGWAYAPNAQENSGITTINWENYNGLGDQSLNPGSYYYFWFLHE